MIFVTAGSPAFEDLIKEMDRIAPGLKEPVIAQIGNGNYLPKNCKWFRFHTPLFSYYKGADIVISHYGAGTIFEVLKHHKKLICLENMENIHNPDLVNELSKGGFLLNCRKVVDLEKYIKKAKVYKFKRYDSPECSISDRIVKFLDEKQ
ncbi:MAG: hypothetical protein HYS62_00845 [Candidatus Aenigmarchaeota archaeon]|nr:hypothetical protein [Candidatus Aenigmarchaeota archaeon]